MISQTDGMVSYWWVEADDQIFSLLRVEGSSTPTTQHVFTEVIAQVSGANAR